MDQRQIDPGSLVSWSTDAVATAVNDEIVLMSLERNRCYGLGSTGSDVWRCLAEPIRVSEIVSRLTLQYEAPPGLIEADVLATLNQLHSEGLVRVHGKA